jgi:hypothetical protein
MCVASLTIATLSQGARAQIQCQLNGQGVWLPTIEHSVADWESLNSVRLSPEVRMTLIGDICRAVGEISAQSGAATQDIDAASRQPILSYLDDILAGGTQFPSVSARLESQFVLGASPQLPEQRRTALVTFRFTHEVDRMQIGSVNWEPPVNRLISQYGTFSYLGSRAGHNVCRGNIVVKSSVGNIVQC